MSTWSINTPLSVASALYPVCLPPSVNRRSNPPFLPIRQTMYSSYIKKITQIIYTNRNYIQQVVRSVCLFVRMSDHNSWTPWPVCLKFRLGNSGKAREWCILIYFEILSWTWVDFYKEIAKIVVQNQVRVNGKSN